VVSVRVVDGARSGLVVGQHPPDLCPSANDTTRTLASEGAKGMPALAEKLGVKILATYVPMNEPHGLCRRRGGRRGSSRSRAGSASGRRSKIYQTSTLEEALTRIQELPTIY
jgi:hypothetical protein